MSVEAAAAPLTDRIDAFVRDTVRPIAAAMARGDGPSPAEVVAAAGRYGLAGLLVPVAHGGAGASHVEFTGMVEAVARECASTAVVLDVHLSVATEPIVRFGDDGQRRRYLPRLASGEWTGAFALTEPGSGSDAASLRTRAVRHPGGYRITGTKTFITNAGAADLYIVMARTGDDSARGISAFLVEATTPGVAPQPPMHKLGLRGSWTAELVLEGVEVPEENRLGAEGMGFRVAMAALDSGRIGISAQSTGIAQGALDVAAAHLRPALAVGGDPFDEMAMLQATASSRLHTSLAALADMAVQTAVARAVTRHAAEQCDAHARFARDAAVAKLVATDACVAVAQVAAELCAPDSGAEQHPAAVRLRDAKACQIYEGSNQVQRIVIARHLLRD